MLVAETGPDSPPRRAPVRSALGRNCVARKGKSYRSPCGRAMPEATEPTDVGEGLAPPAFFCIASGLSLRYARRANPKAGIGTTP